MKENKNERGKTRTKRKTKENETAEEGLTRIGTEKRKRGKVKGKKE